MTVRWAAAWSISIGRVAALMPLPAATRAPLDASNLPALREVRDRYVERAAPPPSTLVQVSGVFRDDVLLEGEAVAAVRERPAP